MSLGNQIDYCIIDLENIEGFKPLVFFTRRGTNEMSQEIWNSKDYVFLKKFIESLDFHEIDYGVFEPKSSTADFEALYDCFMNTCLNYSKELEDSLIEIFQGIISDIINQRK